MGATPSPDVERSWEAEQRQNVAAYLKVEGLTHGEIGTDPAWAVYPYVSVWAVESVRSPGWVGWWAISGDLPTDYCSADGARDPRSAVQRVAESWKASLDEPSRDPTRIASTGISSDLRSLLA
jgi:hypothetical protein